MLDMRNRGVEACAQHGSGCEDERRGGAGRGESAATLDARALRTGENGGRSRTLRRTRERAVCR